MHSTMESDILKEDTITYMYKQQTNKQTNKQKSYIIEENVIHFYIALVFSQIVQ